MKVIHSNKSDSPGYTRYYLDEPIGSAAIGVLVKGPTMKLAEARHVYGESNNIEHQTEQEFQMVLHGQQVIDLPDSVKSLELEDGTTLTLGGHS